MLELVVDKTFRGFSVVTFCLSFNCWFTFGCTISRKYCGSVVEVTSSFVVSSNNGNSIIWFSTIEDTKKERKEKLNTEIKWNLEI